MKKMYLCLVYLAIIFSILSCGSSANNSESAGDARFSCIPDGKQISGKGTDQNINAAFHLTGDDRGKVAFRLSDMNNIGHKLMFVVPGQTGSNTFNGNTIGYVTADFTNYINDPITVVIQSITSSRVSGTFSGKYSLQKGSRSDNSKKQTIEVTKGKFDIPFSTLADWKKLYRGIRRA